MPLTDSLFGKPGIEEDEGADVEHDVIDPVPAPGGELGPSAPGPAVLEATHMDWGDNLAPEVQQPEADGAQHVASASMAELPAEGVTTPQLIAGYLTVPLQLVFSQSPSEGTTIVPSTMSLSRLTTYEGEGNGIDPTVIKRAGGNPSNLFSSAAHAVRRALGRMFQLDK